ncbi:ATP-binding protein (plasmid) [Kitasatospora purpeofusca]|uniref:ATP-binding protein n=1 Tax=Kitasatospora purpeofusca TaxID=67352 RepID=UPI002E114550|nr:ATP-binding protein [Kitasatospora purpeofusca]
MTADRPARHPAAEYRLTLAATSPDPHERTACVPPARNVVRAVATGWGVTGTALDDLVAVASELLANAAHHAAHHAGPDLIRARLLLNADGNRLRIEVEDQAAALPQAVTGPGDDREVTGRGLLIVQALADRWGADPAPAGKAVWAELDLPQPLDGLAVAALARRENARADWTAAARMGAAPVRLPISRRLPASRFPGPQSHADHTSSPPPPGSRARYDLAPPIRPAGPGAAAPPEPGSAGPPEDGAVDPGRAQRRTTWT